MYTAEFRAALKRGGVNVVRLPAQSPDLNAFAERFVLSIKSECLDRIVPLGEAHLRRAVGEFVAHYHGEREPSGAGERADRRRTGARRTRTDGCDAASAWAGC